MKQRRRLIELKKSAELELEEIRKDSPGVFINCKMILYCDSIAYRRGNIMIVKQLLHL